MISSLATAKEYTKKPARIFHRIPLQAIIFAIYRVYYARMRTYINYISVLCVCVLANYSD